MAEHDSGSGVSQTDGGDDAGATVDDSEARPKFGRLLLVLFLAVMIVGVIVAVSESMYLS